MTQAENKAQWERTVFAAFARCSGLNGKIVTSIKSCSEPKPDISCNLDGEKYFFELAEVVPEPQAQALNTEGFYASAFPDPDRLGPCAMVRILTQKQKKKYETGNSPVDLLLYFSKDFPLYLPVVKAGDGAGPTDIDFALEQCKKLGPFSRIWSYCSWNDEAKRLA